MVTATIRLRSASLLAVGLALAALSGCAGGEAVSTSALASAKAKWERAGVRDYDLEWATSGLSRSHYIVEVRDAKVRTIETVAPDGRRYEVKPAQPSYYSVEGLFLTIAEELAQRDMPSPFGQPKGANTVLLFTPDPTYGYPRSYRRDVAGAPMPLAIDVIRFSPVGAMKPAS
jgi:hypothetical protein